MKAAEVEIYKGIEFVRISVLPEDQKQSIQDSSHIHKVIKILRGKELLNDCLKYNDYLEWYRGHYRMAVTTASYPVQRAKELKLVFK